MVLSPTIDTRDILIALVIIALPLLIQRMVTLFWGLRKKKRGNKTTLIKK